MTNILSTIAKILCFPFFILRGYGNLKRYPIYLDLILFVLLGLWGAMAAMVVLAPWDKPEAPFEQIFVNNTPLSLDSIDTQKLVQLARKKLNLEVLVKGEDIQYRTTWGELGAKVDMAGIKRIMEAFSKEGSPSVRYARQKISEQEKIKLPLLVALKSSGATEALVALKETIDRKPENARFNFKKNEITTEKEGLSLDVYETLKRMDEALQTGSTEIDIAVVKMPAKITKAQLANIDTEYVAGFYETPYSRMRKDRDRTHNVKLGASMLDGQVILPGEVFSINDTLGDRSEARGFRYAPVIAGGAIVEGMGGGTCQVASTLYAAAFFAGMIVEERQPHSRPSSYIKLGLDATVSYPNLDLKLRNPFPYPVVIHFNVENGIARVEIRAKEHPYTVTLLRKVVGKRPFPVRIIDSSKLPKGEEVITQLGVPGYTVRRYKLVERGKVSFRFTSLDKYPPTTQFVHRGISDKASLVGKDSERPKPDMHKPYRASNYLRMVQGPNDLWYESTHD